MQGNWKTIIKYSTGMLVLTVSVILALFLPGRYAAWEDAQMTGQAVMSKRERIEFLDTTSLDIAGRLQMLQESETFAWDKETTYYGSDDIVSRCAEVIGLWCDSGLFPEECRQWIAMDNIVLISQVPIYVDQTVFPVYVLRFRIQYTAALTIVLDGSTDLIYYASVGGPFMWDEIAVDLGFDSYERMVDCIMERAQILFEMYEDILDGIEEPDEFVMQYILDHEERHKNSDDEIYDFAAVCGADSAKITRVLGDLGLEVTLDFENFTGYANRRLAGLEDVDMPDEFVGYATMFGTDRWTDFITDFLAYYGSCEGVVEPTAWYEYAIGYGNGEIVRAGYNYNMNMSNAE